MILRLLIKSSQMKIAQIGPIAPLCSILVIWAAISFNACSKTNTQVIIDSIYDISDGLVGYYNFNGGSLNDSSGFGNNITVNSATPTTDRFGNAGNAYSFDGSTSYMQIPNSLSFNPVGGITLMAIIKVDGFNTTTCHVNQILGKGYPDNENGFYCLRITDTTSHCAGGPIDSAAESFNCGYSNTNARIDSLIVKPGLWYNLIYMFDGLQSRLYINGALKAVNPISTAFAANSNVLLIGRDENPSFPFFFNGVIDEIRIYNRALPLGAVKELNNLKQ
jgi:hypothetical protein